MVSIIHAARDISRLRTITAVLARHGFGEIVRRISVGRLHRGKGSAPPPSGDAEILVPPPEEEARGDHERQRISPAVRARRVLEDLGPSFVKLGQIASTRPDVLPADLITELKKLQDSVPPVPFDQIKAQVERSLGAELGELFEHFNEEPLAAASIAQVHRAVLRTNEGPQQVVVKVQRPGIAETIASDIDILYTFAALVERAIPESRIYSPVGLVQQFDQAINAELDFSAEAENALRFARNFESFPNVKFPKPYKSASSKRVLTLEYLDGRKIDDAITHGHSGKKLARVALQIIVKQIFEDGFFHADPHPGNVLVLGDPEKPVFALLDLGMVGRLSPKMRDLTIDLMIGAARKDYEAIANAMYQIGTPTRKIDMETYRTEVGLLSEKYLDKQLKDIEMSGLIRDLVQGATKYGIEIPSNFMLVGKALMTVEGVGKEIDPELDVFEEAKPLFLNLLRKRYSPERIGNELLRRLERLGDATYNMPQQMHEVLEDLRLGRLSLRTIDPDMGRYTDRLGHRIFSGLVTAGLLLAGAVVLAAHYELVGGLLMVLAALWLTAHFVLDAYRGFRQR